MTESGASSQDTRKSSSVSYMFMCTRDNRYLLLIFLTVSKSLQSM